MDFVVALADLCYSENLVYLPFWPTDFEERTYLLDSYRLAPPSSGVASENLSFLARVPIQKVKEISSWQFYSVADSSIVTVKSVSSTPRQSASIGHSQLSGH